MLQPAPLKDVSRYPVTASVALVSIGVTVMWWLGRDVDAIAMNSRVWAHWELWRALTSTLPHVNFFHIAFNLYWFWTFGTMLEGVYGHLRYTIILLLLAFAPLLAEFMLFNGGVGLSGVGYGLWGMLWILEKRDARFAGAVDRRTSETFIIWFFLCVVLTITHVMPVAHVAHGVGGIMGVLLGFVAGRRGPVRWAAGAGLAIIVAVCVAGSTVWWPWINLSKYAEGEIEQEGIDALERHDPRAGVHYLEIAAHRRDAPARAWYNLGVAYNSLEEYNKTLSAWEHAAQMPDAESDYARFARELRQVLESERRLKPAFTNSAVRQ